MRAPLLLLVLALGACTPPGLPDEALEDGDRGTIVTDYGGGSSPVARYVRLPDGRAVPSDQAPGAQDGSPPQDAAPRARAGRAIGTGSAFAVSANGLALTNAHVVQGCAQVVDERGRTMRVVPPTGGGTSR